MGRIFICIVGGNASAECLRMSPKEEKNLPTYGGVHTLAEVLIAGKGEINLLWMHSRAVVR